MAPSATAAGESQTGDERRRRRRRRPPPSAATSATARKAIVRHRARKSAHDVRWAVANSSGGRNSGRIRSGSSVERVGQARDEGHRDPEHHHQRRPRQPQPVAARRPARRRPASGRRRAAGSPPGTACPREDQSRANGFVSTGFGAGCGVRDDDVAGRDAAADQLVAPRAHLVVARVVAPGRPGGDDGPDGQRGCRHQRGDVPHTCHPVPLRRPAAHARATDAVTPEVTGPGGRLRG